MNKFEQFMEDWVMPILIVGGIIAAILYISSL